MIEGHGDDTYRYRYHWVEQSAERQWMNFSSNIPTFVDLTDLEVYLRGKLSLIRSYPEPSPRSLEAAIAHSMGKATDEVLVTSGVTDAIYLIAQYMSSTLLSGRKTYKVVHPTFSEYDSACQMYGMKETEDGTLCWVCNPNNPTGEVFGEDYLRMLAASHQWLIVDQSYEDYVWRPIPDVGDLPNVIVLHSMTKKYCIPGLRLGYVTASPSILNALRECCRPWSVNTLALEAGIWLVQHSPQLLDIPSYLVEAQRLHDALGSVPGIAVHPTSTHFTLCTVAQVTAAELKAHLVAEYGMLIRNADNFRGLTPHHFRVAAQRGDENNALVSAIREYLS